MFGFLLTRQHQRVVLVGCVLASVGVLAIHPTWASAINVDVWNVPTMKKQLREATENINRLDAEDTDTLRRVMVKESIVMEVIANRMTLAEATEQFRMMMSPHDIELLRMISRPGTDQEIIARSVLSYIPTRVAESERTAVLRRLNSELQVMLAGSAGL